MNIFPVFIGLNINTFLKYINVNIFVSLTPALFCVSVAVYEWGKHHGTESMGEDERGGRTGGTLRL